MNLKSRFRGQSINTSLFRKVFLIILSFEMLAFLDIISVVLKSLVLVWGLFILIHNFFLEKLAFKVRHKYIIWSFLTTMTITSFAHMSIWFIPNLALVFYTAMCFFMFYGMYLEGDHEKIQAEMNFILKFFVNFSLLFGFLSLTSLLCRQNLCMWGYHIGIYQNRLIGVYTNSNILAFSMIEGIVACDLLLDNYMKNKFKFGKMSNLKLILCLIICSVCLFLSDSNASFVFIIVYATIRVFCNLFFKRQLQEKVKFFRSSMVTFGFCVLMMSLSLCLRDYCQGFMNVIITDVHTYEASFARKIEKVSKAIITKNIGGSDDYASPEDFKAELHIGRDNYEVSSGRITLFKQGLEVFKHHPLIGVGRANLNTIAKRYIPGGLKHPDLHNGYLTILVSTGIIGFTIFAVFSFVVSLDICRYLFICVNDASFGVFCKLFSALVAYCGYCLFEKAILFDATYMVGFFWSILGYAMSYIYSGNLSHININKKLKKEENTTSC